MISMQFNHRKYYVSLFILDAAARIMSVAQRQSSIGIDAHETLGERESRVPRVEKDLDTLRFLLRLD